MALRLGLKQGHTFYYYEKGEVYSVHLLEVITPTHLRLKCLKWDTTPTLGVPYPRGEDYSVQKGSWCYISTNVRVSITNDPYPDYISLAVEAPRDIIIRRTKKTMQEYLATLTTGESDES